MYPNLYYVFKDWFGVDWKSLGFLNTFGLMVAVAFVASAAVLSSELKRKESQGLLAPREETIMIGEPAHFSELFFNFFIGFLFAYKLVGVFFNKPDDMNPQDYIFSSSGNFIAGILLGGILAAAKWWERNKQKLKEPEERSIRIWPHDRVGDIVIIALIFGIIGAKLFDDLENWSDFIQHPIERLFSASGLTFYGGLILAAIAVCWYAYKKGITIVHLVDAAGPALMIAYAIGRIGCQVSGDGDWGIYNSAYVINQNTKVVAAAPGDYEKNLQKYSTYFLNGSVIDSGSSAPVYVTDRKDESLDKVPHAYFKAPSFIPTWMVAYNFPQNVNSDGIKIPGITDDHNRALPQPVFPTSFYETVICLFLFLFLWSIRKKIFVPGEMFGIYLILNGLERFLIEKMRVNNEYHFLGINPSQAQIISFGLIIAGIILILIMTRKAKKDAILPS
ncbi:MAG TPA: prolipoprotein diacylglyceryl transferase family protein [Ferruginibacter sp.]|nr:prolipoprotein diacylglyceryl transferase family protein [Ferruginibacter sp.]